MTVTREPVTPPGRRNPWPSIIVLAVTVALFAGVDRSWLVEPLELWTLDLRTSALQSARSGGWLRSISRPQLRADELVVVVLDEEAVLTIPERLPIPRRYQARMIDRLSAAGASVITADLFLHGRSADPRDDAELASAIARSGRVIFGKRWSRVKDQFFSHGNEEYFSAPMLAEASVLLFRDRDSLSRRYPLCHLVNERFLPSMALMTVIKHWKMRAGDYYVASDERALVLKRDRPSGQKELRIPITQPNNAVLLDLADVELPFRVVSFHKVPEILQREPDLVRGKIVLVGYTYSAAHDDHPTPVTYQGVSQMAGVLIHGHAIRELLRGSPPRRVSPAIDVLVLVLLGILSIVLFWRLSLPGAVVALFGLALGHLCLTWFLYLNRMVWLGCSLPLLLLGAIFVEWLSFRLMQESRTRSSCETLLSSYFSPASTAGLEPGDEQGLADRLLSAKELLAPDKYEIVSKLGQGGMSVVFKAIQHPIDRLVALKFISPRLYRDKEAIGRFMREARLSGHLLHPNLVAVFDSGESHGVPYIALEYVDGESLKSLIHRKKRLCGDEAAGLLIQALRGLEHVHDHGIIHRDIKSENILLTRDGVVKITDFGIAKSGADDPFKTMQEVIVGTPAYLSPEQIRGEVLTPASDLYSMGIVLYEMLTGGPPFLGESTGAILMKHLNDVPPDLENLGVEISRGFRALLARCLAKSREERYSDAAELREALERLFPATTQAVGVEQAQDVGVTTTGTVSMKSIKIYGTTERIPRPDETK